MYTRRRAELVKEISETSISDERVLHAIGKVPRELFVDPALQHRAYQDIPLPIGLGQTISQPSTVAIQTMLLDTEPGDSVLEVGTGSGYQAAILCEMGVRVYSIERHRKLYERAKSVLDQLNYRVILRAGNGAQGWPSLSPFDGIVVTAGAAEIPQTLLDQLREPTSERKGGCLIIPVGDQRGQSMTKIIRTGEESYESEDCGSFYFVPLVNN